MAEFVGAASFEGRLFAIEAQVVEFQRSFARQCASSVHAPEANCMIRRIVEETWIVQVWPNRKSVDLPGSDFAFDHEAVEAQADIGPFSYIDQTARPVFEFLSANSQLNAIFCRGGSDFEESHLKIEFLLINRAGAADSVRIDPALQLYEGPNVFAVVEVEIEHVPFIEIGVPKRLLSPIVVSNLLPDLTGFAADGQEPIVMPLSKADIFE